MRLLLLFLVLSWTHCLAQEGNFSFFVNISLNSDVGKKRKDTMRDKSKRENERQNERERMKDKIKDMMNNKMREK